MEDRVIEEVYIDRLVEKAATDAELHKRYQEYLKTYRPQEEVKARHILLKTEADAKEVIAELDKGADFAKLADERSTDPSKANGGDLGYFTHDGMVPEFADAAFKLKKGEYTKQPVQSKFGWHVIQVEDRRPAPPPSLEDVKDELTNEIARDAIAEKIKALRGTAKIETFAIDGSPLPAKKN